MSAGNLTYFTKFSPEHQKMIDICAPMKYDKARKRARAQCEPFHGSKNRTFFFLQKTVPEHMCSILVDEPARFGRIIKTFTGVRKNEKSSSNVFGSIYDGFSGSLCRWNYPCEQRSSGILCGSGSTGSIHRNPRSQPQGRRFDAHPKPPALESGRHQHEGRAGKGRLSG